MMLHYNIHVIQCIKFTNTIYKTQDYKKITSIHSTKTTKALSDD